MFSSPLDDDDGDFMSPPTRSSSKLASLFGQDKASFSGGNESLTYTPPKQPKKEKPAGQSQGGGGETTLLCATAVHAYKYVNGQYASQGKLGAAILANHAANDYRILIYASKQQQVTTGKINGNFSFTVQGSNYASFYDDQRQTWSLCFDSDKSRTNLAKQVGLSKFNSSSTSLCTQDLVPGEGLAIELGDALEVKYTGWLWKNNNFGSVFDGNVETDKTFKFKTGKGKVIKGWEQGVIGMKKGSKRLIAIPSPLAYGEKGVSGRVPPNSSLLFEVEVLRVKSSRESTESPVTIQEVVNPQSSDQLPDILSEPSGTRKRSTDSVSQLSATGDSGIKGRTASITEQLSQSPEKGTDKARLLARMSKMGKNPLSLPGAVVAEPENDDFVEADQEVPPSPQPVVQDTRSGTSTESPPDISSNPHPSPRVKPQPPPRPVQVHPEVQQTLHNPTPGMQPIMNHQPMISPQHVMNPQPVIQPAFTPQQQVALYQPPTSSLGYPMMAPQPQIITAPPYSVPPPPPPPPQPQPSANDAMVPVLMAETRQQQGEIRMSIAKLSDKIDELSNKVDRQHQSSVQVANQLSPANQMGVSAYGNPQAVMEASILVHNITRIVQENEKLKVESTEKTKKIEVLNDKISELLQKSQRFVEHSNTMLEQRSDSLQVNTAQSQARVLSLEQDKISMSGELTTAKTQLAALLNEVTSLRQREAEVSSQLSKVTSEAEKFKNELERTKDSHTESSEQSERLKQSLKEEKQTRKQFETKVEHMEEELNDLRNEKDSLEKVLGERKKKHAADKKKCEEELEELRSQQEEEIKFLKEKHKKEKQSSGTATAQQVAQAEAELEERWSEKAERMVAQTEQKWKRRLQEVTDEREEANKKLLELQGKCSAMKASEDSKEEKIKDLRDKLEDLEGIQEKYAQLQASNVDKESEVDALRSTKQELESLQTKYQEVRSRTLKMKEQYEEQLNTAEEERESAVSEAYAKGLREGKVQGAENTQESPVSVNDEVKRIMNTVFYMLRNEFEAGESYTGADIMNVVLKTIKEVTMKLLSGKPAEKEESEEEEEEEEEEEVEEDDENEDEDEDENEDVKVESEEKEVSKEEDEKVEEKEELKVEHEEVTQGEGDSGKEGNNKDAEEEFGENSQKEVLEEVDKGESSDEDTSAEKDTEEAEFLKGIPDANVETKLVEKESSQVNLETSSEDRADEKDSPYLGNTINSVPLQGNEIDVRSLEELSAAVTDENSRTEVDRTSSEFATSLRVENEEGSPFDGLIGEESQPTTETEEKEESFFEAKQEPVKAGTEMDSSKTTDTSEDKLKSLFGDDDHDDVEATFGSLTKKKEKEERLDTSPLRAVPPPLFDDDDDDDDLDWFK
ncbi:FK506-binding protein 15-like [Montipora capricornis]|uniref:FK506-binding protein 15-like n=1 Tax=Montipora capricornis TaxID=246305 RepID=UPI0035F1B716